jgi:carbonic anhydrase/acetyltransferase-like protein (isoleucine patch superfamily)
MQYRPNQVDPSVFVAAGAVVVGDVTIGAESSVWFNAVLRGDTEPIRIGRRTNIQDLCMVHADPGFPCVIGDGVTVGHAAIVHGATVGDNVTIGMHAVVMNGAVIGPDSIVGVGAVVTEGTQVPAGSLVLGLPGKVKRPTTPEEIDHNRHAAAHYVENARRFRTA